MSSLRPIMAAVVGALVLFGVAAAPARADKCIGAKLKAVGKKESGLLSCQSKIAATGSSSSLAPCETKIKGKFVTTFGKAGTCAGDEMTCEDMADNCEGAVASATMDTFPSKCEASKRKAAGKLAQGELGCYSKAATTGSPVDTTVCIPKATGKFSAAITKAGSCPDGGAPQNLVESKCVQPAVTTDGGGMVTNVCPATSTTTTTTLTTTSTTTTTTSTSTTSTTIPSCYTLVTQWGTDGTADGQFDNIADTAVDAAGNVYVVDRGNNRIDEFDNGGGFLAKFGTNMVGRATGIAVDGSGNVFVSDVVNNLVIKFDNTGSFVTQWGSSGSGDGQFSGPFGIGVDASGNVFVADNGRDRIQKFDNSGTFLGKWGTSRPVDVAVDGSGNVFVAGYPDPFVQKFDNSGNFVTSWGSRGSGPGQFQSASAIAVDSSGNVYVADDSNNNVQKFTNDGVFVTAWGGSGSGPGQFNGPEGIAVDASGNVFVSDNGNTRIEKFACQ